MRRATLFVGVFFRITIYKKPTNPKSKTLGEPVGSSRMAADTMKRAVSDTHYYQKTRLAEIRLESLISGRFRSL